MPPSANVLVAPPRLDWGRKGSLTLSLSLALSFSLSLSLSLSPSLCLSFNAFHHPSLRSSSIVGILQTMLDDFNARLTESTCEFAECRVRSSLQREPTSGRFAERGVRRKPERQVLQGSLADMKLSHDVVARARLNQALIAAKTDEKKVLEEQIVAKTQARGFLRNAQKPSQNNPKHLERCVYKALNRGSFVALESKPLKVEGSLCTGLFLFCASSSCFRRPPSRPLLLPPSPSGALPARHPQPPLSGDESDVESRASEAKRSSRVSEQEAEQEAEQQAEQRRKTEEEHEMLQRQCLGWQQEAEQGGSERRPFHRERRIQKLRKLVC